MNVRHHQLHAWSAYPMLVLFGLGFVVFAGWLPPPRPSATAAEITATYAANRNTIIFGIVLIMTAACLYVPFFASISFQMARIEGSRPILAVSQMALGTIVAVDTVLPLVAFAVAAFRGNRDPHLVLLMNDLGWIGLMWPFAPALIQDVVIAFCVLTDKSPRPLFPRWVGYFNIWVAICFVAGAPIPFFHTGPLAWNGLLAFYLEMLAFFGWIIVMAIVVAKAITRTDYKGVGPSDVPAGPSSSSLSRRSVRVT